MKYEKVVELPVPNTEIERLVKLASEEIDIKGDKLGFYNQTIENIASATFLKRGGDFWLIWDGDKAYGYALCSMSKDVDNQMTYWGLQAYADSSVRGKPVIKNLWKAVEEYAKQHFCKHFIIIASRNKDAYKRYLGPEWHDYAALIKKDL